MNILYIANVRIPTERAHGIQIMKTCEALSRAGATVELIVPSRQNLLTSSPFSYHGVPENFTLTKLASPDWVRFGPLGFLFSALWFAESVRWRKSFRTADLIYSRDALVLLQYVLLRRRFAYEAHAGPTFASRIVARRAYKLIAISKGLSDAYIKAGVAPECITIAPDAVDEGLFVNVPERRKAREIIGLVSDKPVVMYVGHLYERKGVDILAAAAAKLPEVLVAFVGGASDDLPRFKERWGKVPNIRILGHVSHERVPLYLRAADLLILPNSAKNEDSFKFTSPMKLFEYMASGTPIIASGVPALYEVLKADSAYLVSPDDAEALAAGITNALEHPLEAEEKAAHARERVKGYTWDKRARQMLRGMDAPVPAEYS
ncbi:MAG TPA: glycosyltransferase family 4 protein [Candidatus Paceibacterota bacterium]